MLQMQSEPMDVEQDNFSKMKNAKMLISVVTLLAPLLDFVEPVKSLVTFQMEKSVKPQLKTLNVEKNNMRKKEFVSLMDVLMLIKTICVLDANQSLMR